MLTDNSGVLNIFSAEGALRHKWCRVIGQLSGWHHATTRTPTRKSKESRLGFLSSERARISRWETGLGDLTQIVAIALQRRNLCEYKCLVREPNEIRREIVDPGPQLRAH